MTQQITGGYVRHRDRMIQESVFQDVRDTLIACGWMPGTTSRTVKNVTDPTLGYGLMETLAEGVSPNGDPWKQSMLPLLQSQPVVLIDFFPESEDSTSVAGRPVSSRTAPNTLAIDSGTRGETVPRELGSNAEIIEYQFSLAFYAISDGVALAVLNDLVDRYLGRLVRPDFVELWDYNSESSLPVNCMDVESFRYTMNAEAVTGPEVHLYFGQLVITDDVDSS